MAIHSCPSCGAPMETRALGRSAYDEAMARMVENYRQAILRSTGIPAHYLTAADRADAHDSADRA
jgi:hypothetical protein